MPKKKPATENAEPTTATASAPEKAKKVKPEKKPQIYKATGAEPNCKLPPQAQGIVNILKEAGDTGLTRDELVAAMEGVVASKQPLTRILAYYQKTLENSGAVEVVEVG